MQKDCRNNPCQRFGSALNLNIHLHMLVLDGAYIFTHDRARFHRAPAPSDAELVRLLDTLIVRITRTLVGAGVLVEDPEQAWLDLEPGSTLEHLSVFGRWGFERRSMAATRAACRDDHVPN